MSIPVGKVTEALGSGYYPTATMFWNKEFSHSTIGFGILCGMNYTEEIEEYHVSFSLFSFPIFFMLRYSYPADSFISGFIETGGGGMVNQIIFTEDEEDDNTKLFPAFSVSCGIRFRPARKWYIGIYGSFLVHYLGNYIYTGICPGILCEIKI